MAEAKCPFMLGKKCAEQGCALYIGIVGQNPNTGEEGLKWGCAIAWLPTLLIENSRVGRSVAQGIESFRNETITPVKTFINILEESMQRARTRILEEKDLPSIEEKGDGD